MIRSCLSRLSRLALVLSFALIEIGAFHGSTSSADRQPGLLGGIIDPGIRVQVTVDDPGIRGQVTIEDPDIRAQVTIGGPDTRTTIGLSDGAATVSIQDVSE